MSALMLGVAVTISIAPTGAGLGTQAVSDTFVSVHDDCLACQHGEDITLWADGSTSGAANAISSVDVRVLALGPVGIQLSLFSCLASARVPFLQALQISEDKESGNCGGNEEGKEGVHDWFVLRRSP